MEMQTEVHRERPRLKIVKGGLCLGFPDIKMRENHTMEMQE